MAKANKLTAAQQVDVAIERLIADLRIVQNAYSPTLNSIRNLVASEESFVVGIVEHAQQQLAIIAELTGATADTETT